MGVIGEAAQRQAADALENRRASGDAGHAPGCARDHALNTACSAGGTLPVDVHEVTLRRVEDARAALPEMLRRAYALDDARIGRALSALGSFARMSRGDSPTSDEDRLATNVMKLTAEQIATVLRVVDVLAAGVGLEARETLGREASAVIRELVDGTPWPTVAEVIAVRLFALGRASVVPPDADLARVIAAWRWLDSIERARLVANAERVTRLHWQLVAESLFCGDDGVLIWVTLGWAANVVESCYIDGQPATLEQWAKLRAACVPVAEGVGV